MSTKKELYAEAQRMGLPLRSKMTKAQLKRYTNKRSQAIAQKRFAAKSKKPGQDVRRRGKIAKDIEHYDPRRNDWPGVDYPAGRFGRPSAGQLSGSYASSAAGAGEGFLDPEGPKIQGDTYIDPEGPPRKVKPTDANDPEGPGEQKIARDTSGQPIGDVSKAPVAAVVKTVENAAKAVTNPAAAPAPTVKVEAGASSSSSSAAAIPDAFTAPAAAIGSVISGIGKIFGGEDTTLAGQVRQQQAIKDEMARLQAQKQKRARENEAEVARLRAELAAANERKRKADEATARIKAENAAEQREFERKKAVYDESMN